MLFHTFRRFKECIEKRKSEEEMNRVLKYDSRASFYKYTRKADIIIYNKGSS